MFFSFKNGPTRASFIAYLRSSQTNIISILQQKYVKNVYPVYGAGIQTHDLWNVSLFPWPLDQGSRPFSDWFGFDQTSKADANST